MPDAPTLAGVELDLRLAQWLGLAVGLLALRSAAGLLVTVLGNRLQEAVVGQVRGDLHRKLLALHPNEMIARRSGSLGFEIAEEANRVRSLLRYGITDNLRHLAVAGGLATVVADLDGRVATWGLLALPVGAAVVSGVSHRLRTMDTLWWKAEVEVGGRAAEHAAAHGLLRMRHAEAAAERRFEAAVRRSGEFWRGSQRLHAILQLSIDVMGAAGLTFLLLFGGIQDDPMRTISLFAALFLLLQPIRALVNSWAVLLSGSVAVNRIEELLGLPEAQVGTISELPHWNSLVLEEVGFTYGERPVLSDINLTVERGNVVGLVGVSGGGKSTLLRLMAGYLEPEVGNVCIGGLSMRELSGSARAKAIGWLDQEPLLLHGTLLENIAVGVETPDHERAIRVLHEVGAGELLENLGLAGRVEERGRNLSAGQRQRIALARTLYPEPELILLDEPTTALDQRLANRLIDRIQQLAQGGKLIVVATHRPVLMAACDKVFEVDQGTLRAVQTGDLDSDHADSEPESEVQPEAESDPEA